VIARRTTVRRSVLQPAVNPVSRSVSSGRSSDSQATSAASLPVKLKVEKGEKRCATRLSSPQQVAHQREQASWAKAGEAGRGGQLMGKHSRNVTQLEQLMDSQGSGMWRQPSAPLLGSQCISQLAGTLQGDDVPEGHGALDHHCWAERGMLQGMAAHWRQSDAVEEHPPRLTRPQISRDVTQLEQVMASHRNGAAGMQQQHSCKVSQLEKRDARPPGRAALHHPASAQNHKCREQGMRMSCSDTVSYGPHVKKQHVHGVSHLGQHIKTGLTSPGSLTTCPSGELSIHVERVPSARSRGGSHVVKASGQGDGYQRLKEGQEKLDREQRAFEPSGSDSAALVAQVRLLHAKRMGAALCQQTLHQQGVAEEPQQAQRQTPWLFSDPLSEQHAADHRHSSVSSYDQSWIAALPLTVELAPVGRGALGPGAQQAMHPDNDAHAHGEHGADGPRAHRARHTELEHVTRHPGGEAVVCSDGDGSERARWQHTRSCSSGREHSRDDTLVLVSQADQALQRNRSHPIHQGSRALQQWGVGGGDWHRAQGPERQASPSGFHEQAFVAGVRQNPLPGGCIEIWQQGRMCSPSTDGMQHAHTEGRLGMRCVATTRGHHDRDMFRGGPTAGQSGQALEELPRLQLGSKRAFGRRHSQPLTGKRSQSGEQFGYAARADVQAHTLPATVSSAPSHSMPPAHRAEGASSASRHFLQPARSWAGPKDVIGWRPEPRSASTASHGAPVGPSRVLFTHVPGLGQEDSGSVMYIGAL
jgi:hypothetical protein